MNEFSQADVFNDTPCENQDDICVPKYISAFYNVRSLLGNNYYPVYNDNGFSGAICSYKSIEGDDGKYDIGTPDKNGLMFGQYTIARILNDGGRCNKLLIVNDQKSAMAAQHMLVSNGVGQYKGKFYHVWSPNNTENPMEDILNNKNTISKFTEIVVGFDKSQKGQEANRGIYNLFRGKVKYLSMPDGCNSAVECNIKGKDKEFVHAWFNPVDGNPDSLIVSCADLLVEAQKEVEMGLSWPWPSMNQITLGIRENMLITIGAGSGVGKTHFTKDVCYHLIEHHDKTVGVIYLEEPVVKTFRSYAGRSVNKSLELPAYNESNEGDVYDEKRDFTSDEKNDALEEMARRNKLFLANTKGDNRISTILKCIDEFVAMGIRHIVLDNLTAITLDNGGTKVDALDEAMKSLGSYKDENPISLFLISHLKKVNDSSKRTPHTHGGEVWESDFRGSNSIVFWSNYVFGVERNTMADTDHEKRHTIIRCVKDRDQGIKTNVCVDLYSNPKSGILTENDETAYFDTGV